MASHTRACELASLLEPFLQFDDGAPARATADVARTDFAGHARSYDTTPSWSEF